MPVDESAPRARRATRKVSATDVETPEKRKKQGATRKAKSDAATTPPKQLTPNEARSAVYRSARRALHGAAPAAMPGRERELEELRRFVAEHLREERPGVLYVSGPPGTGKTAALTTVLNETTAAGGPTSAVYVNCTAAKSPAAVFSRIAEDLGATPAPRPDDCIAAIEDRLHDRRQMLLVVLDEIDRLGTRTQSALRAAFEWPSRGGSRTVLVGVANALDLTERALPRLRAPPRLVRFAPYSRPQLERILAARLDAAGAGAAFDAAALRMLAAKVAAVSGDARRALDVGRRALDNLGGEPRVQLAQVADVLDGVYGAAAGGDALPLQQAIVVCTLLVVVRGRRGADVTVGRLHDAYRRVCAKRNVLAVDQAEFAGLCSLVETRGMLRVAGRGEPRTRRVSLEWTDEEVAAALGDRGLLAAILEDDACVGGR